MEFSYVPEILEQMKEIGFNNLSQIQTEVFEPIINGDNIAGVAPTGSGKTLAFGLPILQKVVNEKRTQVIIIEPTQELAIQVRDELQPFAKKLGLKILPLIGNANINRQIDKLKEKPQVVVGTAGRIIELIDKGKLKAHQVKTLVLDEADELISDRSISKTRMIVEKLPNEIQFLTFGAVPADYPTQIQRWFGRQLRMIDVTDSDTSQGKIETYNLVAGNMLKVLGRLIHGLDEKVLVFANTERDLLTILNEFKRQRISVGMLAANQNKFKRNEAIKSFERGDSKVLLATDLGARGLDIEKLKMVINFHFPKTPEIYLNRRGRTGRMGNDGTVINLINSSEKKNQKAITGEINPNIFLIDGKLSLQEPVYNDHKPAKRIKDKGRIKHRSKEQKNKGYHGKKG